MTPQKRAIANYRKRLTGRGMARFEVLGRNTDRELIRSLAKRLAEDGPEAAEVRAVVHLALADKCEAKGGLLRALRRSPLVGVELDLSRPAVELRYNSADARSV